MSKHVSRYPCRMTPGNPTLHVWQAAAVSGWFSCVGCGTVGVCSGCLARTGGQRPPQTIAVWCAPHHAVVCGKRVPLAGAASLAV